MSTFAEVVRSRAGDESGGIRFEGESWSWAQVVQESADRAAALTASVPRPADRQIHVALLLENVPDNVFWIGATSLAGAVVVGVNSSRSGPEIADDIRHTDVDLIVTEPRLAHLVQGHDHGVPPERTLMVGSEEYDAWLAPHRGAELPTTVPAPDDIAFLIFSSGSTGRPKAVILGQERLGVVAETMTERVRFTRATVTYLCMPLFHGNALMMNLAPAMHAGATVGLARRFSASRFSDDIHALGATFVNYVGRALSYVLSRPADPRDADSSLELAYGTEASEADIAGFAARFGCEVTEGYGMTEGVFRLTRAPGTPPGALGVPVEVDVRVLDEATGEECPRAEFDEGGRLVNPGAVGQVVAIGRAEAFEGYYNNPGAAAERIRGDDFWTGDLAYRDADGYFWFAGRSADWLRVDSENFAAAQVERIIQRMDGILSAPVFAVPDPRTGDQVMCVVEMEPGVGFDPHAFGSYLADQPDLGAKWWPRFVRIVDAMPLTGSNKWNKTPLRAQAWVTDDPVFVRVGRTQEYLPMDDHARAAIEAEFVEHGRTALLPAAPASA
jgi:fatty-acyl-CoA synthase